MFRLKKNIKIRFFLKHFFIPVLIFIWVFSGWLQIGNFPPKIQEAQATAPLPVFRAAGAEATGTGAVTPALPTGVAANDIVILVASTIAGGSISITANGSISSWTEITSGGLDVASGNKLYVWWGRYASGSTGPTVTPGSDHIESATIAYSGVTTSNPPIDVSATGTETTSDTSLSFATGVSTTVDNTMVLLVTSNGIDNATNGKYSSEANTSLASIAERIDYNTSSGLGGGIMVSQGAKATAGTMGTWTATLSAASTKAYISFALKPPQLPTVTTQAASNVEATTATGNGNITATGGQNATAWGVCYKTSSGCTTADSVAAGSGTGGTGAFTASMTSLSPGTTYYVNAYATNSAGTSYGTETTFLTKPVAPTNVSATDGDYNDKVTVTWTKSTGATGYRVYRDGGDVSGLLGDVATFDDTGAGAPSITAGNSVASDGTYSDKVALSLSGTLFNNGTSHTYKVVASNATGNSADSATNNGYRGIVNPTYQWQRTSTDDSGGTYSDLGGATSDTYDDTGAPADGSRRWYRCRLNATGLAEQISSADGGFKGIVSITLDTGSGTVTYGFVATSQDTTNSGVNQTQTVKNNGNVAEDFDIKGQNSANWALGTSAGDAIYKHEWCTSNCDSSPIWNVMTTTYDSDYLATNVAVNNTVDFDLKVTIPSSNPGTNQQNIDVFIRAIQH